MGGADTSSKTTGSPVTFDPPQLPPPAPAAPPSPAAIAYQYPANIGVPVAPLPYGQLPVGVSITSPGLRLVAYLVEILLVLVTLGIGWLIWAAIISGKGQTPAKQLMGQRVIHSDARGPVGFGTMFFMRGLIGAWVAWFAITFTFGILLFMPLWDRRNQNIWDKVSSTLVVNDSANASRR